MERFLALLRLLSRRRRGRRYRADDDYQEGYEDVYYYTSKYNGRLPSESHGRRGGFVPLLLGETPSPHVCIIDTHSGIQASARWFVGNNKVGSVDCGKECVPCGDTHTHTHTPRCVGPGSLLV